MNMQQNVAFFSAVDVDHVLRKEVDMPCLTPSNTNAIEPGKAYSIYDTVRVLQKEDPDALENVFRRELPSVAMASKFWTKKSRARSSLQDLRILEAQMACDKPAVAKLMQPLDQKSTRPQKSTFTKVK